MKGVVILVTSALSWLLFLLMAPSRYETETTTVFINRFVHDMSPLAVVFLLIAIVVQAYAIVNAATTAEKINTKKNGTL